MSTPNTLCFDKWAVVYNPTKPATAEVAKRVAEILHKHGAAAEVYDKPAEDFRGVNAIATIGGDGTMLGCVDAALKAKVPLVGVNMGTLGYLTCVRADRLEESFEKILAGKYKPQHRAILEVRLSNGTRRWALNDVVIKSADFRLAELDIHVDGEHVTEYNCDGIILATPTGSTAYNLSAGGPILHQSIAGIVMTPICPHSLTNRSVIFNSRSTIRVSPTALKSKVHINVDGRTVAEGCDCLPMDVREADERLITLEDPTLGNFDTLRAKLGW